MSVFQLLLEAIIGRLVLELPEEDRKEINKMLKKHFGVMKNAKVQEEDNPTDGL